MHPLRGDEARADTVHGNAVGGDFIRERLGEPEHAGPRHSRKNEPGQWLFRGYGRETDNPAPLRLAHDRDRGTGQMNRRQQVEVDRALPRFGRLVFELGCRRAAGIAEQHVQTPKLVRDILDQLLGLSRHGDVCGERRRLGVAPVNGNLRALGFERVRNRAPDATRPTADERDAIHEPEIHGANVQVSGVGCQVLTPDT